VLHNFEWSAAYAIPWAHVPELVVPRFTGETFNRTYWGPNGLKLHSEYLGLLVVALAIAGAVDKQRRRMILWLGGIGLLFLLIALGASTPFFRLWWEIVPFSKSMRAPGMALFIVAFVTAVLAAFGVDRVASGGAPRFARVALIAGALVALLGLTGAFGTIAESLGRGVEVKLGLPQRGAMAVAAARTIQWSALTAGLMLAGPAQSRSHTRGASRNRVSSPVCSWRSSGPISGSTIARSGTTATRPTSSLRVTPSRRGCIRCRGRFACGMWTCIPARRSWRMTSRSSTAITATSRTRSMS
jgi:hypothetical protein